MLTYSNRFRLDPTEKKDFGIDWEAQLAEGETITASTWTIQAGITHYGLGALDTFIGSETTVWLTGGAPGTKYKCLNQITTSGGRTREESIYIMVGNK